MAPENKNKPAPKPQPPSTPLNGTVPGLAAPTQTNGAETTLFLDIDLKNGAAPMTAVYLPGPLPTGPLDLLVYFHGWKSGKLDGVTLDGMGADQFLTVPSFDFRKMIQGTTKRQFALVVPTLGDRAGSGDLAKSGANVDFFLDMVRKGIAKHLPATGTPDLGNVVLAAHSGGGDTMFNVAKNATTATRSKLRELWCFDCTYSHGSDWLTMLPDYTGKGKNPLPALVKLWVVSTGMGLKDAYMAPKDKSKPESATNPLEEKHENTGTGDNAHEILKYAQAAAKSGKAQTTTVAVYHAGLLHWDKSKNAGAAEVNFTGYKHPSGHNQSVGENLPALVTSSTILK